MAILLATAYSDGFISYLWAALHLYGDVEAVEINVKYITGHTITSIPNTIQPVNICIIELAFSKYKR